MYEKYRVEGMDGTFSITPQQKDSFLQKYPNAVLQSEEPEKSNALIDMVDNFVDWFGKTKFVEDKKNMLLFGKNLALGTKQDPTALGEAIYSAIPSAQSIDETFTVALGKKFDNLTEEDFEAYVDVVNKANAAGELTELKEWTEAYDKYREDENIFMSTLLAVADKGATGLAQVTVQSMARLFNKQSIAAGVAVGGVGTAAAGPAGTLGGFFAGANFMTESMLSFQGLLQDELTKQNLDFTADNIRTVLSDEKTRSKIQAKAIARGGVIGTVEGISTLIGAKGAFSVGKAVTKAAGKGVAGRVASATAQTGAAAGVEAIGGGLGEAAGLTIEGKPLDEKEILLEAIAGLVKAPLDVAVSGGKAIINKPKYTIKGTEVGEAKFKSIIDNADDADLALMDINIENDNEYAIDVSKRQQKAYYKSIVDTRVTGEDRNTLADYEIKRAEIKRKLKDQDTKSNQNALKDIEAKIDEITNKYQDADVTTEEIGREETRLKVLKQSFINQYNKNKARIKDSIKFAEDNQKFVGKDVIAAEGDVDAQAIFEMAREEYNSNLDKEIQDIENNNSLSSEEKGNQITALENSRIEQVDVTGSDGFVVGDVVVINKDVSAATGQINVGAHELLHGIVAKHMQGLSIKEQTDLITDFKNTLTETQRKYVLDKIKDRGDLDENTTEEWFTIFSDGITKGEITFDESTFSKLQNVLQEIFRQFNKLTGGTLGKKEFSDGRQVYNFMKDYQKSIQKGKISKRAKALAGGGETIKDIKFSKEAQDINDVAEAYETEGGNEIWQKEGYKIAVDEMMKSKSLDGLILEGQANLNEFTKLNPIKNKSDEIKSEFINDVYTELNSHIKNYKPERNQQYKQDNPDKATGLFGWINSQLRNKILNVNKRTKYSPDTLSRAKDIDARTEEGAPQFQVADTSLNPEEMMIAAEEAAEARKKLDKVSKEVLEEKLGLDEKTNIEFVKSLETAFGTKLPEVDSKKIRTELRKIVADKLRPKIQKLFGREQSYNDFIKNDLPSLLEFIKLDDLIQMEKMVGGKRFPNGRKILASSRRITKVKEVRELQAMIPPLIDPRIKPEMGPSLKTRLNPTSEELLAFFRGKEAEKILGYQPPGSADSGMLGTRKDRLAELLTGEIAFNKALEVLSRKDVLDKRLNIEELQDRERVSNYVAELGLTIDRDPTQANIKFSKSKIGNALKEEGLNVFEFNEIIKENNLNQLEAKHPALYGAIIEEMENKYGPQEFENKRFLDLLKEADTELAKLVKDQVHVTRRVRTVDGKKVKSFEIKILKDQVDKFTFGVLDFMPNFIGKRDINSIGNLKFLENALLKASSDRGNAGHTAEIRKSVRDRFRKRLDSGKMGKYITEETKKLWSDFRKVMPNLELAESTFDMPESLLRGIRDIQNSNKTAKQKLKEIQKLFKPGSLDAAKKLFIAYNSSIQDWVNYQVNNNIMSREEAISYVIRDKQKNTNFTKGERALGAFTSVYLLDNNQGVKKSDFKGEHVKDSATVSAQALISIYKGTFLQDADTILSGFEQSYIPKKLANQLDKLGGANSPLKNRRFLLNPKEAKNVYDLTTGKSMYDLELGKFSLEQSQTLLEAFNNSNKSKPMRKALDNRIKYSKSGEAKGMSTFDFDETVGVSENFVIAKKGKQTKRIASSEWPVVGEQLAEEGWQFDFSDFNKVTKGRPGPLFQKMKNQIEKYGPENVFILTARAPQSEKAIHDWLASNDINIPRKNVTGLGNSTGEAKAQWMLEKFAEGYNDMYFVDDAITNVKAVKNVLEQLDIKSKVVQAKIKFSKSASKDFNKMLERTKSVGADKIISRAAAIKLGATKGRFEFFVPPSAEDFKGLIYRFLGKGKQGEVDLQFFKDNLFDPFAKGIRAHDTYKQNMANEWAQLKKDNKDIAESLNKKVKDTIYTNDTAIRVYLWDKNNFEIPGLSKEEQTQLVKHVNNNPELKAFADTLGIISRRTEGYIKPNENWVVQTTATDLNTIVNRVGRKEFLQEWIDNKNEVFSPENLNKIEAIYGTPVTDALKGMLHRMETGTNRTVGKDKNVNLFLDWINGSVGATMFFNMRSALLQTLSTVNFINMSDNNLFKASAAFANQPQYWKDFSALFNSDMLKQRRKGLQTDVSASELTSTFAEGGTTSIDKIRAVIRYMLQKGFLPTQLADSFAIASGGATFYRNRINKYIKEGMSEAKAKEQAFLDFQEIAEETQQSSRPDLISEQQAGVLGRVILAWANTPMQYTRIVKKALSDIVNRRGDARGHVSKILYYGFIQNIIFGTLQTGLAFLLFGNDEDEDKIKDKTKIVFNGALDTILRGTGVYGAAISTLKNTILKYREEKQKGFGKRDDLRIAQALVDLSPPIGSKLRKVTNAIKTEQYNKGVGEKLGFRIENPNLSIAANLIEAGTNIPIARLVNKANNMEEAITGQHDLWQRVALTSGWNRWNVGVKDEELEKAKAEVKQDKKQKKTDTKKSGRVRCSKIKSDGKRCKIMVETKSKNALCQYHKSYNDKTGSDIDGDGIKEYRCKAIKSNGQRCKNRTEHKSKKCSFHR